MDLRKRRRAQINSDLGSPDPVISRGVQPGRDFTRVNPAVRNPSITVPKGTEEMAYSHLTEFAEALGSDWDNGKRQLYRSFLTSHFGIVDQEIAGYCMDAEEAVRRDRTRADAEFFKVLYRMSPGMKSLHWKQYHFPSMNNFGCALMEGLGSSDSETLSMADDMMQNRIFSAREWIVNPADPSKFRGLSAIEDKYILARETADEWTQMEQLYLLAYYYSQTRESLINCP